MNSKRHSLSQKGFTLVELLIVIVIIGILAGVVIGVLNPVQQQNRARDAGIRAQIDKMALSAKSLYASSPRNTNRSPTQAEFLGGIANQGTNNCAGTDPAVTGTCVLELTGVSMPNGGTVGCGATGYNGSGAARCDFVYYRTPSMFTIAGKGFATPQQMFMYTYTEDVTTGAVTEGFYTCPTTWVVTSGATGCTLVN